MTPLRRQRLAIAVLIVGGAAATVGLTVAAFRQNLLFFYTPTQVLAGEADAGRTFRLGGMVVEESLARDTGSLEVRFAVTDTAQAITVSYTGVLPDLFSEGQGVVVRGSWDDGLMVADEVLAKHDENYMPVEAAAALEAAKTLQQ